MKIPLHIFSTCLALLLFCLPAQAEDAEDAEVATEVPTEISQPPYEVGDLVVVQGYYIDRGEDVPKLNFRIVDNLLRVYWIDADGLIAEPEHTIGSVRFSGSYRGRPYHGLTTLPSGSGLGAPGVMPPPHIYNVIVAFPPVDDGEPVSHRFRYIQSMDTPVDPTADSDS